MKLLCDEMLKGLARWLRAAGYDTVIADGETDRELLEQALRENRLLLTRDRHLARYTDAPGHVCLLEGDNLDAWARQLRRQCHIDWLHRPLSRCLLCNLPLQTVTHPIAHLPPDVRDGPLCHCPGCGRIYWRGGHARRMLDRLQRWQNGPLYSTGASDYDGPVED